MGGRHCRLPAVQLSTPPRLPLTCKILTHPLPLPLPPASPEFMSLPSTPGPINSMGGAAAASPEALSPEGSGVDASALGSSKRRLSGSLRRLRSALQEFASALSSGAGGSGAGMRP